MPAQTVADLRTLIARRVGLKRRVALLVDDAALAKALGANGCEVVTDPPSTEALAAFRPDVVVAFDGFLTGGAEALKTLGDALPAADLVLSFAHAGSAATLVGSLLGSSSPAAFAPREVEGWLGAAGWVVDARDAAVVPHRPTGLSADTDAALRALLEQVNPDAAVDRFVWTARRGAAADKTAPVEGLVSVLVSGGADVAALEATLATVVRQSRRPLEVVVVAALPAEVLDRAVEPLRSRDRLTVLTRTSTSDDPARRFGDALALCTGRRVALLEAGDMLQPFQVTKLDDALEQSTAAWAVAPVRRASAARGLSPRFELAQIFASGAVESCGWLLDRARLGPFALTLPEGTPWREAVLVARLAALFPPLLVPDAEGVERPGEAGPVDGAAVLEPLRARPVRVLTTLDAVLVREEPRLTDLVRERLEAQSPAAKRALDAVEALAERVKKAAKDAQAQAKAERNGRGG